MIGKFFDWLSNLRPRQLFLLAAGSAIIIFGIMYIGLKNFTRPDVPIPLNGEEVVEAPPIRMVTAVVANRNIEAKSMIVGSMLTTKEIPENQLPPDAVTDVADITNKPAKVRILKDNIITQADVYRNIEQSGFVGSIPPDCRAVSIEVSDVTGVAGFAKPGDYVDVLMIERDDSTVTSRLILQNVLLLSINKSMTADSQVQQNKSDQGSEQEESTVNPATKAIENPALATLALRPDEVLQLVSATKIGEIYLMLRPLVPQGDYYNGAEYSVESLRGKNNRIREEKEKQEKAENENKKKLLSLEEQLIPDLRNKNDYGQNVAPENRIEIMYGNEDKTSITTTDKGNSESAASKLPTIGEVIKN